jgi:hypothetical protein
LDNSVTHRPFFATNIDLPRRSPHNWRAKAAVRKRRGPTPGSEGARALRLGKNTDVGGPGCAANIAYAQTTGSFRPLVRRSHYIP